VKLLDPIEAAHYVGSFSRSLGAAASSHKNYCYTQLRGHVSLAEGSAAFSEYRDCTLRESERCLLLSIVNYRRSLNMMTPASSSWAAVTLYYTGFFAASALLGMFGGWVLGGQRVMSVLDGSIGRQRIESIRQITTYRGSHQQFWDAFYVAIAPLQVWLTTAQQVAVTPVVSSPTWLIDTRNNLNYDAYTAVSLASSFQQSAGVTRFPTRLPGTLSTMFSISLGLLELAVHYARQLKLRTDALDQLDPPGHRIAKIRKLILDVVPPRLEPSVHRRRVSC
jgi:hypothetical protein